MSTETTAAPQQKKPVVAQQIELTKAKPDAPKSIPVRVLAFFEGHPSLNAAQSIATTTEKNRSPYAIEYIPQMRHHRVEIRSVDKPPRVLFIHEANVANWEPLEA